MSDENTIGREPVQILEIITPKCALTHGTAPCEATQTGSGKCFNTSNTCNDFDNFQSQPLSNFTPDLDLSSGDTIASGDIDRTADIMVVAEVRFPASPSGTIWEQGGSADEGAYLGITGTDLVFRAGDGTVASGTNTGKITSPISNFAGRSIILIGEIDLTDGAVRLWEFDTIELVLTKIGEDAFTPPPPPGGGSLVSVTGATSDTEVDIGGTIYRIVEFGTSGGNISVGGGETLTGVEYTLVGGGGGAGGVTGTTVAGGGGGGGEVVSNVGGTAISISGTTNAITVGAGGAGGGPTDATGADGGSSTFAGVSAGGGGGGALEDSNANTASNGTGGGGGGGNESGGIGGTSTGTAGDGANGDESGNSGGGGGGAGANASGPNGGDGVSNSITGTATFYGGGGGSDDADLAAGGTGGQGGGADGIDDATPGSTGNAGTDGLGGGGGSGAPASNGTFTGGDGGDGIAIIRWPVANEPEEEVAGGIWAGEDGGAIGEDGGSNIVTGEDGGTFNGTVVEVRFYEGRGEDDLNTNPDGYRQRYFFDDGRRAKPGDPGLYILPLLGGAQPVGSRINVTGADQRYEPLGRRAYLGAEFKDAPHSDFPYDPYLSDRNYNPLDRSTFWAKWLIRNKFGKTRAVVRLYHGYDGQNLADMQQQLYVLDAIEWSRESVSMRCRDYLSLTEFRRTQVPAPSPGKLEADILAADTSFDLSGDQTGNYPASGTLRIDEELMTYTGPVTYDAGSDTTTIANVTRGTDGSTAADHDADEGVQLCRRYTNARIDTVLEDLIVNDAAVPAQIVDLAKFTSERDEYLDAYELTTLISEPTGVDQLIGEIAEQCSFYIWWNERRQIVDMQAIRPLDGVDAAFTQERDIISDTFEIVERPKERLTTISFYYNPRDLAGDLSKPVNYKNQLVVSNSTVQAIDRYGRLPQTREVFSRWLTTEAQVNQTASRYSLRYADVPFYVSFMVDAKDRQIWVGDFVSISHDFIVDARGNRALRRWLVVEAEEIEPGHAQRLVCVDVTLDGQIYRITENGIGSYTAALFAEGNAFITDNNGLNPDGTTGATIA